MASRWRDWIFFLLFYSFLIFVKCLVLLLSNPSFSVLSSFPSFSPFSYTSFLFIVIFLIFSPLLDHPYPFLQNLTLFRSLNFFYPLSSLLFPSFTFSFVSFYLFPLSYFLSLHLHISIFFLIHNIFLFTSLLYF